MFVHVSLLLFFRCAASAAPTLSPSARSSRSTSFFPLAFACFLLSLSLSLFAFELSACGYASSRHTLPIFSTKLPAVDARFHPRLSLPLSRAHTYTHTHTRILTRAATDHPISLFANKKAVLPPRSRRTVSKLHILTRPCRLQS